MLEAKVETHFVDEAQKRGGWAAKVIGLGFKGFPDRAAFMPGGRLYLVELKRPKGGTVAPWQTRVHKNLATLGFVVHVLWTVEQVDDFWRQHDGS